MSYLDVPRIHFGGPFFTGPATINNVETNYLPDRKLEPVWNPNGVSLFYFQGCRVLSAVGADSSVSDDATHDPLIGAKVETPSSETPKNGPDGRPYDTPKLVDLDPDQQGRSEVYGLRLFVTLPGVDAGFSGLMSVPNLRSLNGRIQPPPNRGGSWFLVGTLQGVIADVDWFGDLSVSPFLSRFKQAVAEGISVRLLVDLHQNQPAFQGIAGDEFCYGRVMGTLGAARACEPDQFVAGRWLETAPGSSWNSSPFILRRERGSARRFASIDLGGAILLDSEATTDPPNNLTSKGRFSVNDGIRVGRSAAMVDALAPLTDHDGPPGMAREEFVPLTHGEVSFDDEYREFHKKYKDIVCVANAGVVDVELTEDEAAMLESAPLEIALGSAVDPGAWVPVLAERHNGRYINCRRTSLRVQQPKTDTVSIDVQYDPLVFGAPPDGPDDALQLQVLAVTWTFSPNRGWRSGFVASEDVTVDARMEAGTNGKKTWWLTVTAHDGELDLAEIRQSQQSRVYYIVPTRAAQADAAIGDNNALLTVLLWRKFTTPDEPTWDQDVGPILTQFATLYPGMKSILDIGDESIYDDPDVRAKMKAHLGAPREDPAYMPVTRDLSDARVAMILKWLESR